MNRSNWFIKSTLRRNLGLVSTAVLAAVYTVPRVGSDTQSIQGVLFPVVATQPENTPGWDLSNLDNARVDSASSAIVSRCSMIWS